MDLLGPASAPNAVTSRPADTRIFAAIDTFFKDCTSPTSNDGTKLQAAFMNGALAQLRAAIRGNGNTAISSPIVTEDNTDDAMLLSAIKHLMQRGLTNYATDTGTANAIVLALSPAPAEFKNGLVVRFKKKLTNTLGSGMTLTLNALGTKAVKRADGTNPGVGDLIDGIPYEAIYDQVLDQWILLNFGGAVNIFNSTKAPFADYSSYSYGYNGTITLNDGVNTIVNYQGASIGPNNDTALVSGGCKIIQPGRYFIVSYAVLGQHTGTTMFGVSSAGIMKNSSIVIPGNGVQSSGAGVTFKQAQGTVSGIVDCALNDVLNAYHYQVGAGAGMSVDASAIMTITRVH